MKIKKNVFFFLILLCIISSDIYAQKRKTKPINSGFVFIDGKYIDAPYTIKRKGLTVYINGIQVTKELEYPEKNPYEYNIRLGIPPCLNKNSTISDIWKCNEPLKGFGYTQAMFYYFFTHYEYYAAYDSIVAYYKSLPNIKTFELTDNGWIITTFNNEKQTIACFAFMMDQVNKKWGPNGTGPIPKKEFIRKVENRVEHWEEMLSRFNDLLILFTEENNYSCLPSGRTDKSLPFLYQIINNPTLETEKKIDTLSIIFNKIFIKKFIKNYQSSPQFEQRIKKLGFDTLKTINYFIKTGYKLKNNKNKKSMGYYSPDKKYTYAWCSNTFEFTNFESEELKNVDDYIKYQDFVLSQSNTFTDNTPDDDNFGNCTYSNLKSMKNAGLLYFAGHGRPPNDPVPTHNVDNGIFFVYATNENAINNWCNNDPLIIAEKIDPKMTNWNAPEQWGAFAYKNWAQTYWQTNLTQSKAITILSACYSAANGWVDGCAGGIAFGYGNTTLWSHVEYNNEHLLKRMNGSKSGGTKREATEAYDDMPNHYDGFTYSSNNSITLCPATVDYTHGEVTSSTGTGHFEVDTYCDANTPTSDALLYQVISGTVSINNIHWTNVTEGQSNRIEYQWDATDNFQVKFTVDVNNFKSWGASGDNEFHRLDFDRVTPIVDNPLPNFDLYRNNYSPVVNFFADNINIPESSTVNFTDLSTYENISLWYWNFGNGNTSTAQNPHNLYNNEGLYDVSLTITNPSGQFTETKTGYITVFNENSGDITCSFSYGGSSPGSPIYFNAEFLGYNSPDYTYQFTFDYGDGIETVETNCSSANKIHYYSNYGSYTTYVNLKILDNNDDEVYSGVCSCGIVEIENPDPCSSLIVNFSTSPNPAQVGLSIQFTNQTTGGIHPYVWSWTFYADPITNNTPDGGVQAETFFESSGQDGNPNNKTYSSEGIYPVKLTVMDNQGCSNSKTIDIHVIKPNECYNNLSIYSNHSDQLFTSNYLLLKWREDGHPCGAHLLYNYDFNWSGFCYDYCSENFKYGWVVVNPNSLFPFIYTKEGTYNGFTTDQRLDYNNFPHPGFYNIDLYISTDVTDHYYSCSDNAEIKVGVIDCNRTANSSDVLNAIFNPNSNNPNVLVNNSTNPQLVLSGTINLNNGINSYINNNNVTFSACNEVVMEDGFETGDGDFTAEADRVENCQYYIYTKNGIKIIPSIHDTNFDKNDLKLKLEINPNLVINTFKINFYNPNDQFIKLQIFNTNGILIYTVVNQYIKEGYYTYKLSAKNYKSGLYICKCSTNNKSISKKFIKI